MNRRGFLQLIGMAAPALVLDPERLLWVPGQKTFFLPPVITHGNYDVTIEVGPSYVSGNTLLTVEIITRECLRVLENNLKVMGEVNRTYDDENWPTQVPRWRA